MTNPLDAKPLYYLIGADASSPLVRNGKADTLIEVPYDCNRLPKAGIGVGYVNLFDENNTGAYKPYLHDSDTAEEYGEGQIDANGPGFEQNLREQFNRRQWAKFKYVELDNPDAYSLRAVKNALLLAASYGFQVFAKNPGLGCDGEDADDIFHTDIVVGMIVESGAGSPESMDRMRTINRRPTLPVWFVFHGSKQRARAVSFAQRAKPFVNMGVTWSAHGEYTDVVSLLEPHA